MSSQASEASVLIAEEILFLESETRTKEKALIEERKNIASLYKDLSNEQRKEADKVIKRKDKIIKNLQATVRRKRAATKSVDTKKAALLDDEIKELRRVIEALNEELNGLKQSKLKMKAKMRRKNIEIKRLKKALADYVEEYGAFNDGGSAEEDGADEEKVALVEADNDEDDVAMAGDEYEAKGVENVADESDGDDDVVLDDDGVVVDVETLLEATQSDPDDSDFEVNKGEIEEEKRMKEKDIKFEKKELKGLSNSEATSRSSSLEVVEREL